MNLDALCKRFGVDNTARTLHGALLDAQLLAEVYLELLGGQEPSMLMDEKPVEHHHAEAMVAKGDENRKFRPARDFPLTEEEIAAHEEFISTKLTNALWKA